MALTTLESLLALDNEPKTGFRMGTRPKIPIILNGRILKALLDTGASVSLIREACLVGLKFEMLNIEEGLKIFQAASDELVIIGKVHFHSIIMERCLSQQFYVIKELNEECIIGMDAIHDHGIVIDGRRQFISFNDNLEKPQTSNVF
jgi:hypothetical protein